jgi:Cytochrome C oxidase, cbb3-type, subunit III
MFPATGPRPDARSKPGLRRCVILGLAIAAMAHATAARAENEDPAKIGLEVWKSSGCADCHGTFADGDKQRDEMPTGANLRGTKLDRSALKETISCGRPDTGMPAFDKGAYKARACYGQPLGVVPANLYPPPRLLTAAEIDSVITYLQARVIGRRKITHEDCLYYYYDLPSSWCDDR